MTSVIFIFLDVCSGPSRENLMEYARRVDLLHGIIKADKLVCFRLHDILFYPNIWNSLPDLLKHFATSREHFRKELKTYLFRKAYAPASENY